MSFFNKFGVFFRGIENLPFDGYIFNPLLEPFNRYISVLLDFYSITFS